MTVWRRNGVTVSISATSALSPPIRLPVVAEQRDGYDRGAFSGWNDSDGDGCDTRDEVLIDEDMSGELGEADCDGVMTGEWVSIYDDTTITQSSQLDNDHFVPLAEVWDSGASQWSDVKRDTYATFLDDDRHLVAVTAAATDLKGIKIPRNGCPPTKH